MNQEELNQRLCNLIEQIYVSVPSKYINLVKEAAYHADCRDKLRQSANLIARDSKDWTVLAELAKQHPSQGPEYRRLMHQAREQAPPAYQEHIEKAREHDRRFKELSSEAKQHLPRGGTYRYLVTQVVGVIQSTNLATNPDHGRQYVSKSIGQEVSQAIYNAALSNTWLWFCENLCRYDSSKGFVLNWLNNRLLYAVREELRLSRKADLATDLSHLDKEGQETDFWDTQSDTKQSPSAYAELSIVIESIWKWLRSEEKKLKRDGLRKYPQVNCYTVIARSLPIWSEEMQAYDPPRSFEDLAEELEVPVSTLHQFFNQRCRPKLQGFN